MPYNRFRSNRFFRKKRVRYNHIKRNFVVNYPANNGVPFYMKIYQPSGAPVKITGPVIKVTMQTIGNTINTVYTGKYDLVLCPEGTNPSNFITGGTGFPLPINKSTTDQVTDQIYGNEKNLLLSDIGHLYTTGDKNSITSIRTWISKQSLSSKRNLDEQDALYLVLYSPKDLIGNGGYSNFSAMIEFITFSTVNT